MFELTPFARNNHFLGSYDPFKAMEEFEKNFFGHQVPAFKTDIRETENAYVLDAELPGFRREDIHAEVRNGYLTIHAEHKTENEEKLGFYSCTVPTFMQYVLTELIDNGDFERHINRVRRGLRKQNK